MTTLIQPRALKDLLWWLSITPKFIKLMESLMIQILRNTHSLGSNMTGWQVNPHKRITWLITLGKSIISISERRNNHYSLFTSRTKWYISLQNFAMKPVSLKDSLRIYQRWETFNHTRFLLHKKGLIESKCVYHIWWTMLCLGSFTSKSNLIYLWWLERNYSQQRY